MADQADQLNQEAEEIRAGAQQYSDDAMIKAKLLDLLGTKLQVSSGIRQSTGQSGLVIGLGVALVVVVIVVIIFARQQRNGS